MKIVRHILVNALLAFPFVVVVSSCEKQKTSTDTLRPEDTDIPLVRLLACPEKYEKRPVMVEGFIVLGFEVTALYMTEEHYKHALTKNALSLVNLDMKKYDGISHSYVRVTGKFMTGPNGIPPVLYAGEIYDIQEIERILPEGVIRGVYP